MTKQNDWLIAALNNVADNPNAFPAVGTLSREPQEDGGRYGGGIADYSVWK